MRHILLFENFEDDIDPFTREMFGLENEFFIEYTEPTPYGDKRTEYCKIKGPSENFDWAEEIVDEIKDGVEGFEKSWADEGRYVDDKKDGYGVYTYPDGRCYKGMWSNGK